jgi:hypothetical protein
MLAGPQKASPAPAMKGPLAHGQGIGRLELHPPGGGAHGNHGVIPAQGVSGEVLIGSPLANP